MSVISHEELSIEAKKLPDLTSDRMIVHLINGTHELFRHFYGIRCAKGTDPPYGAVGSVLWYSS